MVKHSWLVNWTRLIFLFKLRGRAFLSQFWHCCACCAMCNATLLWNAEDVSSSCWANIYLHPVGDKRCFLSFARDRWIYVLKLGLGLSTGELSWVSERVELRVLEKVVIISVGAVKSGDVFSCKGNTIFWRVHCWLWGALLALPVRELPHKAGDELGAKGGPSTCTGQGAAPQGGQRSPAAPDKARGWTTRVHPGHQQQEAGAETGAAGWRGREGCTTHMTTR